MWHLPGSTGHVLCQYDLHISTITFTDNISSLLPEDGVTFIEDGVTLQLQWQDTANVGHVFTSRCTIIPRTCCF